MSASLRAWINRRIRATYVCVYTLDWSTVMIVLRVITRVGVAAVTVVLGPNSLPDTIVTGGGVMVDVRAWHCDQQF